MSDRPVFHRGVIQVAGVRDAAEARLLLACGVRWLGFPLRLAVHAPDLPEAAAAALIHELPPTAVPVLITYLDQADAILTLARFLGVRAVQLHGEIATPELAKLRVAAPELFLSKSLILRPDTARPPVEELRRFEPLVDAFITDTFDPATGAAGATGKTHDWRLSRALVAATVKPVILAGGLTPANVAAAISAVRPAGVDVHTGVEDPATGGKSPALVRAFAAQARAAFAAVA
ncbi:MAG: phosphoribosylanthranilate isomerase [bacterium]